MDREDASDHWRTERAPAAGKGRVETDRPSDIMPHHPPVAVKLRYNHTDHKTSTAGRNIRDGDRAALSRVKSRSFARQGWARTIRQLLDCALHRLGYLLPAPW